jgi:iron complex outermembrane receptor protein
MLSVSGKAGLLLGAAFAGIAINGSAMAQDAADTSASGDIIVTARRVEERLQDVPISITVMNQQQLSNRNITIANDLANYTPSLSTNERYGPEKQSFSLRGFNQDQSTAPTVGVYFAEVVGVRAQGGTTSGNTVGAGAFMDLANVQVLKGPQGTLFGRNTTGGAILLTPQKPTDRLEGYVEGSAGDYNMWRLQGALNLPLSDTFKVRLAADHMQRDGFMHNLSGIGPSDYNNRNYTAVRLSIVADLTPDLENYTIFHYSHSDTNGYTSRIVGYDPTVTGGTRGLTALGAAGQIARQTARGDSFYDVESAVQDPFLKLDQWQAINTTTWKAGDSLTVKNIMSYGEFRERAHFDLYSSNFQVGAGGFNLTTISPFLTTTGTIGGTPIIVPAGTKFKYIELDTAPGQDNSAQSTFTEELQLQGHGLDGKLNYVIGGYLEFSRPLGNSAGRTGIFLNCTRPQDFACTNPLLFGSVGESRTQLSFDNNGVFAQATYKFTDRLSMTGGFRYTFDNITGFTTGTSSVLDPTGRNPLSTIDAATGVRIDRKCTDSFRYGTKYVDDPNNCKTTLTNKSTAPTWLVDLDYKPINDVLFYAKYARGYRQGGINFTNPGVETWKPEHMDSFELGAKTSFRGAVSGYFNLTGFYNKLRDMQIFAGLVSGVPSVAGGAAIVNAGSARSYGLEADGSVTLFNSLRFDLGYAYLNTKVTQVETSQELLASGILNGTPFINITPTVSPGSQFTLAPQHKLTLTATYTLPLAESVGRVSLGGTMLYQSSQIANGSVPASCGPTQTASTTTPGIANQWCYAPTTVPLGVLPGRTTFNLNVNWDNVGGMPIDAAFFMTNVTNKLYFVNTGGGFTSAGFGDVLLGEPRMWGFRLKYRFGQ